MSRPNAFAWPCRARQNQTRWNLEVAADILVERQATGLRAELQWPASP